MRVLVVNAGSSSLKLRLLGPGDDVLASQDVDHWRGEDDVEPVGRFVGGLDGVDIGQPLHEVGDVGVVRIPVPTLDLVVRDDVVVASEEAQLQAGGPGVDDEDTHRGCPNRPTSSR